MVLRARKPISDLPESAGTPPKAAQNGMVPSGTDRPATGRPATDRPATSRPATGRPATARAPRTRAVDESATSAQGNLGLLVGRNLHRLRTRRGWSLDTVAKLSGVSRAMLGQIENARSVPTINVVWKIACAFDVPFSAMIADHGTGRLRVLPATETKILASASGDFSTRALFPFEGERKSEFYEIRMKPGGVEEADPHAPGTVENLVVVEGALEVEIGEERRLLSRGDAIQFRADCPHTYRNPGEDGLLAYLVMTYAEPAG